MAQTVTISEESARFCMGALESLGRMVTEAGVQMHPERGLELVIAMAELDRGLDQEMNPGVAEKARETLTVVREMMQSLEAGQDQTEEEGSEETEEVLY